MCVAGFRDFRDDHQRTLRVATKFPNIARAYFAAESREIDIIELHGSIELAPILGLSDVIVDIVETGKTLAENGLAPLETVAPVSARLIANKACYKFKEPEIRALYENVKKVIGKPWRRESPRGIRSRRSAGTRSPSRSPSTRFSRRFPTAASSISSTATAPSAPMNL